MLVTERMRPLRIDGRTIHQIWLPDQRGPGGLTSGDMVNDLTPMVVDPNVHIQEYKAGTCDLRAGRGPQGDQIPTARIDLTHPPLGEVVGQ